MVIVAGYVIVRSGERERFLAGSFEPMKLARRTEGCRSFVVAPDPLVEDRVNIYEEWESEPLLQAFRENGPDDTLTALITEARVQQYQV